MQFVVPEPRRAPLLDPGFQPAALTFAAHHESAKSSRTPRHFELACLRPGAGCSRHEVLLHPEGAGDPDFGFLERYCKTLLWLEGASELRIAGEGDEVDRLAACYSQAGARAFDARILGPGIYRETLRLTRADRSELPAAGRPASALGRHTEGCRVGFDLGGSDRKCAAVIDGEVLHSEEIPWDPYFETDPEYHYHGIEDSIARAAAKLPRLDAIGGSAAGVYVDGEPRVASLFRGVDEADFERSVRPIFRRLQERFGGVPFEVANDGDVTALAASMQFGTKAALGLALGTSLAAGYCDEDGHITGWLNELAFAPLDLRADAPTDEWSGDSGCGVQYLSQQAIPRLAAAAEIEIPGRPPLPEQLVFVQQLLEKGDARAERVFRTIGSYLGYAILGYREFYRLDEVLVLGRVASGEAGKLLLTEARAVLDAEAAEFSDSLQLRLPDERFKRHGQAIAAASLPELAEKGRSDGKGGAA